MYTKTKYCCSLCDREYDAELSARNCENLGVPPETANVKKGDTLNFIRNISNAVGEVRNWVHESGKVVGVTTHRNDRLNTHQHVFIVETENELGKYEGLVSLLDIEGKNQYFMASTPRYELGFAATLKNPKP